VICSISLCIHDSRSLVFTCANGDKLLGDFLRDRVVVMHGSECWWDQPGFGCAPIEQKLGRIQYYSIFNILLKLYNIL
jgi:hypothetical protein